MPRIPKQTPNTLTELDMMAILDAITSRFEYYHVMMERHPDEPSKKYYAEKAARLSAIEAKWAVAQSAVLVGKVRQ